MNESADLLRLRVLLCFLRSTPEIVMLLEFLVRCARKIHDQSHDGSS